MCTRPYLPREGRWPCRSILRLCSPRDLYYPQAPASPSALLVQRGGPLSLRAAAGEKRTKKKRRNLVKNDVQNPRAEKKRLFLSPDIATSILRLALEARFSSQALATLRRLPCPHRERGANSPLGAPRE